MPIRRQWIWGISGLHKYAVKDLTEIEIVFSEVKNVWQVIARKRIGYDKVLLKEASSKAEGIKFINETFPSR